MNPITHGLLGWCVASLLPHSARRDRALITLAAVAPDLDGLGLIVEWLTRHSAHPKFWWTDYHHTLAHNLAASLVAAALAFVVAKNRWPTACLTFLSFQLHLFCDVIGARGPDGDQWPIPYFAPFSSAFQWSWSGQWALNAWQNVLITIACLGVTFILAWRRGYSPLEMVSRATDRGFVAALRRRVPPPG